MVFIFDKDYVTKTKNIKAGTKCNVLNYEVVIGENEEWLFDVDSQLASRYGHILDIKLKEKYTPLDSKECRNFFLDVFDIISSNNYSDEEKVELIKKEYLDYEVAELV